MADAPAKKAAAKKPAAKKTTVKKTASAVPKQKVADTSRSETLHGVDYEVTPDRGFRRKS